LCAPRRNDADNAHTPAIALCDVLGALESGVALAALPNAKRDLVRYGVFGFRTSQ
jgi:hypothetical protein